MYGRAAGVTALIPAIGALTPLTTPTQAQAEAWLAEATVLINGALAAAGYSTTVDEDAAILPALEGMAHLYAAANAVQARGLDSSSGGDENRSELMFKRFYMQLNWLSGGNLTELGVTLLVVTTGGSRRIGTRQMRRNDGYSATYEGSATEYAYPSE